MGSGWSRGKGWSRGLESGKGKGEGKGVGPGFRLVTLLHGDALALLLHQPRLPRPPPRERVAPPLLVDPLEDVVAGAAWLGLGSGLGLVVRVRVRVSVGARVKVSVRVSVGAWLRVRARVTAVAAAAHEQRLLIGLLLLGHVSEALQHHLLEPLDARRDERLLRVRARVGARVKARVKARVGARVGARV